MGTGLIGGAPSKLEDVAPCVSGKRGLLQRPRVLAAWSRKGSSQVDLLSSAAVSGHLS